MQSRNLIYVLLLLLSVAPAVGLAQVSGHASSLKVRVQRLEFKTPVPLSSERQKLTASLRRVGWKFSQE